MFFQNSHITVKRIYGCTVPDLAGMDLHVVIDRHFQIADHNYLYGVRFKAPVKLF